MKLVIDSCAEARLAAADSWLRSLPSTQERLVVGTSLAAARETALRASRDGSVVTFGWHRVTLGSIAHRLAEERFARDGVTPLSALARRAVVERVVFDLDPADLGPLGAIADTPGFPRALAATLSDLRLAGLDAAAVAAHAPGIAVALRAYEQVLRDERLADRADGLAVAAGVARAEGPPPIGLPLLLLDIEPGPRLVRELVAALVEGSDAVFATAATGDEEALAAYGAMGFSVAAGSGRLRGRDAGAPRGLRRLQSDLFRIPTAGKPAAADAGSTATASAAAVNAAAVNAAAVNAAAVNAATVNAAAAPAGSPGEAPGSEPTGQGTGSRTAATAPPQEPKQRGLFGWAETPAADPEATGAATDAAATASAPGVEEATPLAAEPDDSVTLLSAPGADRECVEIARWLAAHARRGVAFDRMAVLLRAPEAYRAVVSEAFARAGIPVAHGGGTRRPDPAGRALIALLACAEERLSARRFAEYLSLGELPDASPAGAPPPAVEDAERWVPPALGDEVAIPEDDLEDLFERWLSEDSILAAEPSVSVAVATPSDTPDAPGAPVRHGTLRTPLRWERLVVEASVIGGIDRWTRRLRGLREQYELDRADAGDDDGRRLRIDRELEALDALTAFAMPLLVDLDALPAAARWREWIDRVGALATRALRSPERVLAVLAELAPMGAVGPVRLAEVRRTLEERLLDLPVPPPADRHGRVLVSSLEACRGLSFEVIAIPGFVERVLPPRIAQDPLLPDAPRAALGELAGTADRIARERVLLRLGVGAAEHALLMTYPRIDAEQGRPAVPSFYALEAMRAAQGRLAGFRELQARAEAAGATRLGWPAPEDRDAALDDAEYDLNRLAFYEGAATEAGRRAGRYLLSQNPHLARALRFRSRREWSRWTPMDGLLEPGPLAREALAAHTLEARSFSATALQAFADCPYRFLLKTIHRFSPREVPEPLEELSPLERGSLFHEVQFELLTALRAEGLLPVTPERLPAARARLDAILATVADAYADRLAPAIARVWERGVARVLADLGEWLRRMVDEPTGFVPDRFELSFGLRTREGRDESSRDEPVPLDCGIQLRGSIDLVERTADGLIRVTDHKTGRARVPREAVIHGGKALQPVLYGLAAEKLLGGRAPRGDDASDPGASDAASDDAARDDGESRVGEPSDAAGEAAPPTARVVSGRLYYCTAGGGFETREVPLDPEARESARVLAAAVGGAVEAGFLPAYPDRGACRFCDYQVVCGAHEERRVRKKPDEPLGPLLDLRARR